MSAAELPPYDPYARGAAEAHAELRAITQRATESDTDVLAAAILRAAHIIARAIGNTTVRDY